MEILGNLFSETILLYFSLLQLSKTYPIYRFSGIVHGNLKTVSKFWYRQCRRAYFIQFGLLKAAHLRAIELVKEPKLFVSSYCHAHQKRESDDLSECPSCKETVCKLYWNNGGQICKECFYQPPCSVCGIYYEESIRACCRKHICDNCFLEHKIRKCDGVNCNELKSAWICGDTQCCDKCLIASFQSCFICKEVCFCTCSCDCSHSVVYFCSKHNLKKSLPLDCPIRKTYCPVCKSETCCECGERTCFINDSNTCTMVNVYHELLMCSACFNKKTKIMKRQKKKLMIIQI
jgi:hypothetical protein